MILSRQIGVTRHHLATIDSTNRFAKTLVPHGAEHGTLVTAEIQTSGRGRFDRSWLSDGGQNILASFILYPGRAFEEWGCLPLLIGLAVQQAINRFANVHAGLKWPNDVLIDGRKLSGILVESGLSGKGHWAIAGIGINVNQPGFAGTFGLPPTSLFLETGRTYDRYLLLDALMHELTKWMELWEHDGNAPVIDAWRKENVVLGKHIFAGDGEQRRRVFAEDLAPDGSLVIINENGARETLYAGDIFLTTQDGARP